MASGYVRSGLLAAAWMLSAVGLPAQPVWYPGQSVSRQTAQSGFQPGQGAIMGGPGNDPTPDPPMYVCCGTNGARWSCGETAGSSGESGAPAQGIEVRFVKGTAATAGQVTVTNGATGKTVTEPLPANSAPQACVLVLQQAAFEAGMQIQALGEGAGLRVFGSSSTVNVTGASATIGPF